MFISDDSKLASRKPSAPGTLVLGFCMSTLVFMLEHHSYAQNIETDTQLIADNTGSNLGQSLFDELFLNHSTVLSEYQIPFPFEALLSSIESKLGNSVNRSANKVKKVFIPLGRCISRTAASPDFFRSPRVVIAVDSEDISAENRQSIFLKDRLFIGYQQNTDSMEVISYNDEMGRFEFQVVNNYRQDGQPRVEYVERNTCTNCHQNEGPIFSRAPWDETNNNREIFQLLVNQIGNVQSEPPPYRGSQAADIDGATNRANLFALSQEFWSGVCNSDSQLDEIRCRAAVFELVLQYRLQQSNRLFASSELIRQYLIPELISNIQSHWPQGISIPSADIRNQNPLSVGTHLHLYSAEELKKPRTLMINWRPGNLDRIMQGLGRLLSLSDIKRLDRRLHQLAISQNSVATTILGNCDLRRTDEIDNRKIEKEQTGDIAIRCLLNQNGIVDTYELLGDFYIENGKISELSVYSRLVLDSQTSISGFTHAGSNILEEQEAWVIRLKLFDSKRVFYARLPNGSIVDEIEIRWPKIPNQDSLFTQSQSIQGQVKLRTYEANRALELGLSAMIDRSDKSLTNVFSKAPFRGKRLMVELFDELEQIKVNATNGESG